MSYLFMKTVLIYFGLVFVVGASRKFVTTIAHHAVHHTFGKWPLLNRVIAEIVTTITLSASHDEYEGGHSKKHHIAEIFITADDPDAAFMLQLGFVPGESKKTLWARLIWTIFSPSFHLNYLWDRVKLNFWSAPNYRILMSVVWWSFIVYLAAAIGPLFVALSYLLPVTVLFQISALLQFISEHEWMAVKSEGEKSLLVHAKHSWGRFIGPELPREEAGLGEKIFSWPLLLIKMIFVDLVVRIAVLPGDLSQHDQHHRKPMGDWANACYERFHSAITCDTKVPYSHFWSLREAIDHVFGSLSQQRLVSGSKEVISIQNKAA